MTKIRGKYHLINGFLALRANLKLSRNDLKTPKAAADSPDPHLGLALVQMSQGNLDEAEEELRKAERNGFKAGRREQKDLADGYRPVAKSGLPKPSHPRYCADAGRSETCRQRPRSRPGTL